MDESGTPSRGATATWAPLAVAVGLAALMLWLAGEPFAAWVAEAPRDLRLRSPIGDVEGFPRRFQWAAEPGAGGYEIEVVRVPGGEVLFRQRGPVPGLELDFDPGADPGPGDYRWTVRAVAGSRVLAEGRGEFRVTAGPAPPDDRPRP